MTVSMNDILRSKLPPGVYSTRSRFRPATIRRAVEERGWHFAYLNGRTIEDKASFLEAIAQAMSFPSFFGRNWDALNDSITDLSWIDARGYLLLYDDVANFAETYPDEWATAHEILSEAADSWQAHGIPFYVMVRGLEIPR